MNRRRIPIGDSLAHSFLTTFYPQEEEYTPKVSLNDNQLRLAGYILHMTMQRPLLLTDLHKVEEYQTLPPEEVEETYNVLKNFDFISIGTRNNNEYIFQKKNPYAEELY